MAILLREITISEWYCDEPGCSFHTESHDEAARHACEEVTYWCHGSCARHNACMYGGPNIEGRAKGCGVEKIRRSVL